MKKAISFLLVICMLLSLALMVGCAEKDAPDTEAPAATAGTGTAAGGAAGGTTTGTIDEATLEASKPNEYIKEKLDAGMEVQVAFIPIEFGSSTFIIMDDGFREGFEGLGMTYMSSAYEMDTAKHMDLVENYIQMGVAMIISICLDDSLTDLAAKAIESGTYFCVRKSLVSYPTSFNAASDPYVFGGKIADMMLAWVDYKHPNAGEREVKLACVTNEVAQVFIVQHAGIVDRLNEDGRINLCYTSSEVNLTTDTGYTFAEAAYMYDPEITMYMACSFSQAIGVSNYLLTLQGVDFDNIAVFATDVDEGAAETVNDPSNLVRGFASEGGEYPHEFLFEQCVKLLFGELEPGQTVTEPAVIKTSFGYELDERVA